MSPFTAIALFAGRVHGVVVQIKALNLLGWMSLSRKRMEGRRTIGIKMKAAVVL